MAQQLAQGEGGQLHGHGFSVLLHYGLLAHVSMKCLIGTRDNITTYGYVIKQKDPRDMANIMAPVHLNRASCEPRNAISKKYGAKKNQQNHANQMQFSSRNVSGTNIFSQTGHETSRNNK